MFTNFQSVYSVIILLSWFQCCVLVRYCSANVIFPILLVWGRSSFRHCRFSCLSFPYIYYYKSCDIVFKDNYKLGKFFPIVLAFLFTLILLFAYKDYERINQLSINQSWCIYTLDSMPWRITAKYSLSSWIFGS